MRLKPRAPLRRLRKRRLARPTSRLDWPFFAIFRHRRQHTAHPPACSSASKTVLATTSRPVIARLLLVVLLRVRRAINSISEVLFGVIGRLLTASSNLVEIPFQASEMVFLSARRKLRGSEYLRSSDTDFQRGCLGGQTAWPPTKSDIL